MARVKKGGDQQFRQETKRLDRMRWRRTTLPILVVIVAFIAFAYSPWRDIPRGWVNSGIRFVHSLVTGGEVEPDAVYW